jgi:hypothetical protein
MEAIVEMFLRYRFSASVGGDIGHRVRRWEVKKVNYCTTDFVISRQVRLSGGDLTLYDGNF